MRAGKLRPDERKEWRSTDRGKHSYPIRVGKWDSGWSSAIVYRGERGGYYVKAKGRKHRRYFPIPTLAKHTTWDKGMEPTGKLGKRLKQWISHETKTYDDFEREDE